MAKLIINADDFGLCKGVNLGIIEGFTEGTLTSTSMMANMPGFDNAIILAKENPKLPIGAHLTLTTGYPVSSNIKSLVNDNGQFKKIDSYINYETISKIDLEDVEKEWISQIEKLIEHGIYPSHLDTHHYVQNIPGIKEVFFNLARKYNLPTRYTLNADEDIKSPDKFVEYFDKISNAKGFWKEMELDSLIKDCKNYNVVETACHPGYVDDYLIKNSSFSTIRAMTLSEIKDNKFIKTIKENKIELISYKDI